MKALQDRQQASVPFRPARTTRTQLIGAGGARFILWRMRARCQLQVERSRAVGLVAIARRVEVVFDIQQIVEIESFVEENLPFQAQAVVHQVIDVLFHQRIERAQ